MVFYKHLIEMERRRNMTGNVLNADEACIYLKIAKVTLYKYVRQGAIPAYKMGKVWRFDKNSLDDWIKKRVQQDTEMRTRKASRAVKK